MSFSKHLVNLCFCRYDHLLDQAAGECKVIRETFDGVLEVSRVLKAYYTGPEFQGPVSVPPWKWEVGLKVPARNDTTALLLQNNSFMDSKPRPIDERSDFASWSFYFVLDEILSPWLGLEALEDAGRGFAYFFTMDTRHVVDGDAITAGTLIRNSLVCDFEAVTFCKKQSSSAGRKNLFSSFIVAYVLYLVLSVLLDAMLITRIVSPLWKNAMLLVLVPWLGFQLAYGVGPTCFPMVPTCLLQDVMMQLQMTVPIKIVWPNALQKYPGCLDNNATVKNKEQCLMSCRGQPFYFRSWESSLSWSLCSILGHKQCVDGTRAFAGQFSWLPSLAELEGAVANHSAVIAASFDNSTGHGMDMWHAHQFCFFVTLGQAVPYFLLAVVIVMAGLQLVKMPFALVAAAVQFVWQAIAFTHSAE